MYITVYLLRFLVHMLAMWIGTKVANIEEIDFGRIAVATLVSYVAVALGQMLLGWLTWLPLLGWILASLIWLIGVALAVVAVMGTKWGDAFKVAFTAMIVQFLLSWLPFM
jgi:hypothetical protein